jgi:hypothetical protein
MLRSLLLVSALIATIAACSPADPPLLIDGGQAPAAHVVQEPPADEPQSTSGDNAAVSR